MLSLSPRWDLVRFLFPKELIPDEVNQKWLEILNKEPGVFITPIDYLNESITNVSIGGISDINVEQSQVSTNTIERKNSTGSKLGRINREPKYQHTYVGSGNPYDKIDRTLTVTLRMNQGLFNYFILFESLLYRFGKPTMYENGENMYIDILDELGTSIARIELNQCNIEGMDGLDLGFDKVDRSNETFQISFKFNEINYCVLEVPQT